MALVLAGGTIWIAPAPQLGALAFTFLLVLVAGSLVHSAAGISPRRLSIPGVWFWSYVVLIALPAHWVAADHDYGEATVRFLLAARLGLTLPAIGIWVGAWLFGSHRGTWEARLAQPVEPDDSSSFFAMAFALAAGIGLLLTGQYLRDVPTIPLFYMIQNPRDYLMLTLLREESLKLLVSRFRYVYYLLRVLGFPLLTMIAWGTYRVTRHRGWLAVTILVGSVAVLFASLSIAKAPVAFIVLAMVLYHYLDVSGRLGTATLVVGAALFLVFPLVVIYGTSSKADISFWIALREIARRVAYEPALTLYEYFEVVPAFVDFQGGRTIGMLSRILGWEPFNIENAVALIFGETTNPSGIANAAFVSNLYVDWGYVGVVLGSLLTGGLLAAAHALVSTLRRTPVALAVTAHLMFTAMLLSLTTVPVVLMSNGALLAPLAGYALVWTGRALRTATTRLRVPSPPSGTEAPALDVPRGA